MGLSFRLGEGDVQFDLVGEHFDLVGEHERRQVRKQMMAVAEAQVEFKVFRSLVESQISERHGMDHNGQFVSKLGMWLPDEYCQENKLGYYAEEEPHGIL